MNRTRDRPPLGDARRCGERVVSAGHPRRKKNTRSPLSGPHYSLSRANSLEITVVRCKFFFPCLVFPCYCYATRIFFRGICYPLLLSLFLFLSLFFQLVFRFFLLSNVSGLLLACACCACPIQHDGMAFALPTPFTAIRCSISVSSCCDHKACISLLL